MTHAIMGRDKPRYTLVCTELHVGMALVERGYTPHNYPTCKYVQKAGLVSVPTYL